MAPSTCDDESEDNLIFLWSVTFKKVAELIVGRLNLKDAKKCIYLDEPFVERLFVVVGKFDQFDFYFQRLQIGESNSS
jgi:hypothetical protein